MKAKNSRAATVTLITLTAIIIISNTPPAQYFLLPRYSYENGDRSFTYTEEPGGALDFTVGKIRWERFKKQYPDNSNLTLYRTFSMRPWEFWQWWQYIAHHQRFALPKTPRKN